MLFILIRAVVLDNLEGIYLSITNPLRFLRGALTQDREYLLSWGSKVFIAILKEILGLLVVHLKVVPLKKELRKGQRGCNDL